MPHFNRLLITGAAGNLGRELRRGLAPLATTLRLSDRDEMAAAGPGEEVVVADVGDFDAMLSLVEGCDAVVHFGAAPVERPWEEILHSSIKGGYNVYEAARRHGVKRIIYASSNHAVGYHLREKGCGTDADHMPDTLYGLSKCFVEDLAKLYWHKFGIESVCLRIGSCFPEPVDRRMLSSWMSYRDCVQLVSRCLTAERVAFSVAYGISNNQERFFDNEGARHIGYAPQDCAETFREKVEAANPPGDPNNPAVKFVGGVYTTYAHPDE